MILGKMSVKSNVERWEIPLTRLHLPYAIVVRLHVRKSNVVILTPETAVTVGV